MKYLLTCLLVGCLINPAWSTEHDMTFEKFVQKLEKAEPWTREKVEAIFGAKFTMSTADARTTHTMFEPFINVKGLIIKEVSLEIPVTKNKTNILTVTLDDKSSCFSWERILKSYPNGYDDFDSALTPGGPAYYVEKRSWGELLFGFNLLKRKDCVESITIITNEFIRTR